VFTYRELKNSSLILLSIFYSFNYIDNLFENNFTSYYFLPSFYFLFILRVIFMIFRQWVWI